MIPLMNSMNGHSNLNYIDNRYKNLPAATILISISNARGAG